MTTLPPTSHGAPEHRRFFLRGLALACGIAALSACQSVVPLAQPQERGILLQRMDALVQGAQGRAGLRLMSQPDPVHTGQTLTLGVSTSQTGYLYVYQVATDGRSIDLVFPNAFDGANYIPAGTTQLPRAGWQLRAQGPAGVGYFVAVLASEPLNLMQVQAGAQSGQFTTPALYSAATSTLRELAR